MPAHHHAGLWQVKSPIDGLGGVCPVQCYWWGVVGVGAGAVLIQLIAHVSKVRAEGPQYQGE